MEQAFVYLENDDVSVIYKNSISLCKISDFDAKIEKDVLIVYCNTIINPEKRYITLKEFMSIKGYKFALNEANTYSQFYSLMKLFNKSPLEITTSLVPIDMTTIHNEYWTWGNPPTLKDIIEECYSITSSEKALMSVLRTLSTTGRHYTDDITAIHSILGVLLTKEKLKYLYG